MRRYHAYSPRTIGRFFYAMAVALTVGVLDISDSRPAKVGWTSLLLSMVTGPALLVGVILLGLSIGDIGDAAVIRRHTYFAWGAFVVFTPFSLISNASDLNRAAGKDMRT